MASIRLLMKAKNVLIDIMAGREWRLSDAMARIRVARSWTALWPVG